MPNFNQLVPREEADERMRPIFEGERKGAPQVGAPYAIHVNAGWRMFTGLLCKEPPYGWIRAFDLDTGETLWETVLPAGGQTTPITYSVGGRQYVVIYPGGHHFMETAIGDQVIAYSLPREN